MRMLSVTLQENDTVTVGQVTHYAGEHNATRLKIQLSTRLKNGFDYYNLCFDLMEQGKKVSTGNIYDTGTFTAEDVVAYCENGFIYCDLPQQITACGYALAQVEAIRQEGEEITELVKSPVFRLEFERSVMGDTAPFYAYALGQMPALQAKIEALRKAYEIRVFNWDSLTDKPSLACGTGEDSLVMGDTKNNQATAQYAMAQGAESQAKGYASHAQGWRTFANGQYAHTEGFESYANERGCHAEGYKTQASKFYDHAEGEETVANGRGAHAQNRFTQATGMGASASGFHTHAKGTNSFIAGEWGEAEEGTLFAVANGKDANHKCTAFTVDRDKAQFWVPLFANGKKILVEGDAGQKSFADLSYYYSGEEDDGFLLCSVADDLQYVSDDDEHRKYRLEANTLVTEQGGETRVIFKNQPGLQVTFDDFYETIFTGAPDPEAYSISYRITGVLDEAGDGRIYVTVENFYDSASVSDAGHRYAKISEVQALITGAMGGAY